MADMKPTPKCIVCDRDELTSGGMAGQPGPEHLGDCVTQRGRLLARRCRECAKRFPLYSSRSTRVRCQECIAAHKAKHPRKATKSAFEPFSLAQWRHKLETEADPNAALRRIALFARLKYEVGRAITCQVKSCGSILDVETTVVFELTNGSVSVICAKCAGATIGAGSARTTRINLWKGLTERLIDGREIADPETRRAAGMLGG